MPVPSRRISRVNRRGFVKAFSGATAMTTLSGGALSAGLFAGPTPDSAAETLVGEFYKSLSGKQLRKICFPFNHPLRNKIDANWNITEPEIGDDFYTPKQRILIEQIVRGITTQEGYDRFQHQMNDDSGGLEHYSVAIFGEPGKSDFEFELTGRHLTLRADGNSVDKAAFGGPIAYGHGIEEPEDNLFYDQTVQTNKVFQALDADQAKQALVRRGRPKEAAVQIQGAQGKFPGISVAAMSVDQKHLVGETLDFLLAPFRKEDREEVQLIVDESGGVDSLNMAFYKQGDLKSDNIWDIWRVEGPSFVWHFRGAPHVHAYINIGHKKTV